MKKEEILLELVGVSCAQESNYTTQEPRGAKNGDIFTEYFIRICSHHTHKNITYIHLHHFSHISRLTAIIVSPTLEFPLIHLTLISHNALKIILPCGLFSIT